MNADWLTADEGSEKLYPRLSASIWPVVITVGLTLLILYFDATQGFNTNPVIVFSVPLLYLFLTTGIVGLDGIIEELGLKFHNYWEVAVAVISGFIMFIVGTRLAQYASTKANWLISIYPFNLASVNEMDGVAWALLSISPQYSFVLYFVVAVFEEAFAFLFGKSFANFIYAKGVKNKVAAEIIGFLMGRASWAALHWFAYGGFEHPILYVSAFFLGMLFYFSSWITGMIAHGVRFKTLLTTATVSIPFAIIAAIAFHWGYNFGLANLMTIIPPP